MIEYRHDRRLHVLGGGLTVAQSIRPAAETGFDTTGLISWWTMDETSGTRYDSHGSNDLSVTITDPGYATGVVGNAADFQNNINYTLQADADASLTTGDIDFTIALWVNSDVQSITRDFFSKWDNSSQLEFIVGYNNSNDRIRFVIRNAADTASVTVNADNLGSPSTDTWYFIVAWHDATANTLNIQVNNGTVDSVSHSGGVNQEAAKELTVGSRGTTGSQYDGLIDEISFWKRVLTDDERTWLFNSGNGRTYSEL